ncbi:MAG TPA: glycosyltransferase family 4 protein [Thermoanaerobaculia bacterium]|nr:glycosyltransferase family 4 protein [Thermoanaerobaculia bacterium]
MSRVLLVCPEPLGHRQPAGIGIRFLEMANVLRAAGHELEILSPDQGLTPENIHRGTSEADVAVVQGHVANDLFAHMKPLPVVVDLYDPFIVENLHYYGERGAEVFTHDHATLVSSLHKGDFFLCASEAQRLFYLGVMLAVGRLNPIAFESDPHLDSLIRIAPFGVGSARAVPSRASTTPEILFGGIYDWYDPILAMDAVAIARAKVPMLKLTFNTHPNPELTPQSKTAQAMKHAKRRDYDFVRFEPWVAYEERAAYFDHFTLALLTFPQSIETDLAMRTRIYDYLWAGLPIVTSSAPGTDELLERYHCGSVLKRDDPAAFASEIVAILTDRERYERMVLGTRSFVVHHQWDRTLRPLVEFCAKPMIDGNKHAFAASMHVPHRPATILQRLRRRMRR